MQFRWGAPSRAQDTPGPRAGQGGACSPTGAWPGGLVPAGRGQGPQQGCYWQKLAGCIPSSLSFSPEPWGFHTGDTPGRPLPAPGLRSGAHRAWRAGRVPLLGRPAGCGHDTERLAGAAGARVTVGGLGPGCTAIMGAVTIRLSHRSYAFTTGNV